MSATCTWAEFRELQFQPGPPSDDRAGPCWNPPTEHRDAENRLGIMELMHVLASRGGLFLLGGEVKRALRYCPDVLRLTHAGVEDDYMRQAVWYHDAAFVYYRPLGLHDPEDLPRLIAQAWSRHTAHVEYLAAVKSETGR